MAVSWSSLSMLDFKSSYPDLTSRRLEFSSFARSLACLNASASFWEAFTDAMVAIVSAAIAATIKAIYQYLAACDAAFA
jgi:hypothetical protein